MQSLMRYSLACCLISFLGVEAGWAQRTTGSIGGVIQDPTGAVVPGVSVQVTNQDTRIARSVQSNEVGVFLVPFLQPGSYTAHLWFNGKQAETISFELPEGGDENLLLAFRPADDGR